MTTDRELHQHIGAMGQAMKDLKEGVAAMRAGQEKAEARADEREREARAARRELHAKIDEANARVAALDGRVKLEMQDLSGKLDDVSSVALDAKAGADDYRRVVQQGKGVMLVVGLGGTAFGASVILFFESMVNAVKAFGRSRGYW